MPKIRKKRQPLPRKPKVLVPGPDGTPVERPRVYLPMEETLRRLEPYEKEAVAGMPDVELARKTGVSVTSVRRWRLALGIRHPRGKDRRTGIDRVRAMALFGDPYPDVLQRADVSSLNGQWAVPEFNVRRAIKYNLMMEQLHLLSESGYSVEEIAEGQGYTEETVEQALEVYTRHMQKQPVEDEDEQQD